MKLVHPDLSGELHLPTSAPLENIPALVILPSSAGVCDVRERMYARFFAVRGCACLIADAFAKRGLTQCMTDQSLLSDQDMLEDARAAFRWLAQQPFIGKKAILGVSKGGSAALNTAMLPLFGMRPTPGSFDLHISIAPSCAVQPRHLRVTGAPLLLLLGGMDDYTGCTPALLYAQRLRAAGALVETVVFPEAHHGWELCGKPVFLPDAERYDRLFLLEDDGSITDDSTGTAYAPDLFLKQRRLVALRGAHAGGGTGALRRKTCETILDFMRRHNFLADC